MNALNQTPDSAATISIDEIDFSKYRTKELVDRIGDLVGIQDNVGRLVIRVVQCVLIGMCIVYGLMRIDEQSTFSTLLTMGYGLPASILFAIALWLVLLIRRSLSTLTRIVDLLLQTTVKIATDFRMISSGQKKMPSMAELVGAVYEHVFMHTFREVVSNSTGFLGKPIFWAYKLTVDRMLRVVVRYVATWTASEDEKEEMKQFIGATMPDIAESESWIVAKLEWVRKKIVSSGNWLASRILWPCYVVIAGFFVLLVAPIVAVLILG